MPIDKKLLSSSPYRDRFLQELGEHQEDARHQNLGTPEELIITFNMYVHDIRKQKLEFAAKFAFGIFLFMYLGSMIASILPPELGRSLYTITGIVQLPTMIMLYLPLLHLGVIPVNPATNQEILVGIIVGLLGTILTSLFWATAAMLVRYPPKIFTSRTK